MEEQKAIITLFGASGDLAARKLYPSLFKLYKEGALNEHFAVLGTARRPWTDEHFRSIVVGSICEVSGTTEQRESFANHFYYLSHNVDDKKDYDSLKIKIDNLNEKYEANGNYIFYLAMAPQFFGTITENIKAAGLKSTTGYNRIVVEKPFGHDLKSAEKLNNDLKKAFENEEIYRIDHYLGKQIVQGILPFRFANPIFQHIWNAKYIKNVQITLAETVGVETRGAYYETSGALRDMFQNHVLQLMSLIGMNTPLENTPKAVMKAKSEFYEGLNMLQPNEVETDFVRGQYGRSTINNMSYAGYRSEDSVNPKSNTETFFAGKVTSKHGALIGVPFYVRSGKRLRAKSSRIDIVLKKDDFFVNNETDTSNVISILIDGESGFTLTINNKSIAHDEIFDANSLKRIYSQQELDQGFSGYERLILDVLLGQRQNFAHWNELKYAWKYTDVILDKWESQDAAFPNYTVGTMGPEESDELLQKNGDSWFYNPPIDSSYFGKTE